MGGRDRKPIMTSSIVCGVDHSPHACATARFAALLAERLRSQLVIVGEPGAAAGAERGGGGHAATVVVGAHGRGAGRSGRFASVSRDVAGTSATPVGVRPKRT
jgi:nucleotide-binding universal stress UspA family protein